MGYITRARFLWDFIRQRPYLQYSNGKIKLTNCAPELHTYRDSFRLSVCTVLIEQCSIHLPLVADSPHVSRDSSPGQTGRVIGTGQPTTAAHADWREVEAILLPENGANGPVPAPKEHMNVNNI